MTKTFSIASIALLAALFLAACGREEVNAEREIRDVIDLVDGSRDPTTCTTLLTQRFNEQLTAIQGPEAVKTCESQVRTPEGDTSSLTVSGVEVEGSTASAHISVTGGSLDGQILAITLVQHDSQWQLDEIDGFASLNRPKLIETFLRELNSQYRVSESLKICIRNTLEHASHSALTALFFSGSIETIHQFHTQCTERDSPSFG
jgi:hypothetical protein